MVSDMKDRLSPNMAPLTTTPSIRASGIPVLSAIPTATGAKATIVPTDVPTEMEMKQAARNIPAANKLPGRMDMARFTVASTAPIALAVWAKAPARMKIKHDIAVGCPPAELLDPIADLTPFGHGDGNN